MNTEAAILISIIMPVYNRGGLIAATIASIQQQTYSNWELIIVDDGSDDDTGQVVAAIHDNRIHYTKMGRIGIGGVIKNTGLKLANGSWIAFMDSDDLWHPQKLEKQVQALLDHPQAALSLTGGYNFKEAGKPLEYFYRREGMYCGNIFAALFNAEIAAFAQALLFKKECISKTGYFKETGAFSDVDFIAELAYYFDAVVLYEPLLYRRLHADNFIQQDTWKKSYYAGISTILHFRTEKKLPDAAAKDALYRLFLNFGESALAHHDPPTALRQFYTAWCMKPFRWVSWKKWMKGVWYWVKG